MQPAAFVRVVERALQHGPRLLQSVVGRDEIGVGRAITIEDIEGLGEGSEEGMVIVGVHGQDRPRVALRESWVRCYL